MQMVKAHDFGHCYLQVCQPYHWKRNSLLLWLLKKLKEILLLLHNKEVDHIGLDEVILMYWSVFVNFQLCLNSKFITNLILKIDSFLKLTVFLLELTLSKSCKVLWYLLAAILFSLNTNILQQITNSQNIKFNIKITINTLKYKQLKYLFNFY